MSLSQALNQFAQNLGRYLAPRAANMICAPVILATQAMFTIAPSMIADRKFLLVRAHRQPSTKCVGNGTTEVPWAQTATTA